jgi:hypothetical protein
MTRQAPSAVRSPSSAFPRVHRPVPTLSPAAYSGHPGWPGRTAFPSTHRPWKDVEMASKPKPQQADDAVEQARRALQTSMDTRQ